MIKTWFSNFINLFFPSISAYRTHDKDIIEYIENNTLIEMNCKRILNLSLILAILPLLGVNGLFGVNNLAFTVVLIVALVLAAYTVFVGVKVKQATKMTGNGFLSNKKYYEKLYESYWITWIVGMLIIGFSKLNASMNGSYLYLSQLCLAFFPLVTPKKLKKIGICTVVFAALLAANLLYYGKDMFFVSAVVFIVTNMILVFIMSFIVQRLNLSINVMVAYVKLVGFLDSLTAVYNRRGYQFRICEMVSDEVEAGVIMLDVDFFKQYNDTYGHMRGDEILKTLASTIKSGLDLDKHLVVRFGGEEFAIICLGQSLEETRTIAENIMVKINNLSIPSADTSVSEYLTVSIGISTYNVTKNTSLEELVEVSDKALYKAKEEGRNRIVVL